MKDLSATIDSVVGTFLPEFCAILRDFEVGMGSAKIEDEKLRDAQHRQGRGQPRETKLPHVEPHEAVLGQEFQTSPLAPSPSQR